MTEFAGRLETNIMKMPTVTKLGSLLLLGSLFLMPERVIAQSDNRELIAKGQYIFAVAGGCACHTSPKNRTLVRALFQSLSARSTAPTSRKIRKPAWARGPTNRPRRYRQRRAPRRQQTLAGDAIRKIFRHGAGGFESADRVSTYSKSVKKLPGTKPGALSRAASARACI